MKSEKGSMKIAIITDSIEIGPTSSGVYTESLVKELLKIKDRDAEITLIHGERNDKRMPGDFKEIIVPFPISKKYNFLPARILFFLIKQFQIFVRSYKSLKVCERENFDVVHIPHLGRPAPSLLFLKIKSKLVVTNHGMAQLVLPAKIVWGKSISFFRIFYFIEFLKWKYCFRNKFAAMITVSNSTKIELIKGLGVSERKIRVIYHGVDHDSFKPIENKSTIKNELFRKYGINYNFLLHISVYQPKKNVERIINAFKKTIEDKGIKERLILIGNMPDSIKNLIEKYKLEEQIILLGFIDHQELPKFFNVAKGFIFPSLSESFGLSILEAMGCGCPVITSNISCLPEITGKGAVLVNPYNTEELAEAIYKVLSDDKLRNELREKGLKRVAQFSWEKCAKEHLEIYREVSEK